MSERRIGALETEGRAAALADLDMRPTAEVVGAVVDGHDGVHAAVGAAEPAIAALVDAAAARHAAGGRIVYTGAGSAGWIAFARRDGDRADVLRRPRSGARRRRGATGRLARRGRGRGRRRGRRAPPSARSRPTASDVVIAVSASGRTPWAVGGLAAAGAAGALTAAIVCATGTELAGRADHAVEVPVGAEAISGSTRLKAGTAQKVVLNTFSTALMVRRGRTLGDLMTSMRVANAKLRDPRRCGSAWRRPVRTRRPRPRRSPRRATTSRRRS